MWQIGDIVEWVPWTEQFGKQRGSVIEVHPMSIKIEYGPWCDTMIVYYQDFGKLTKVKH